MSTSRPAGSIDELDQLGRARQHADLLHLRRQRLERRGPERHDQRAPGAEQIPNTIDQQLAALDELGGLDALGGPEDRQHVPRRLGLGRQHAVPAHQAGRLAFRRHPQPAGRLLAEAASSPTRRRGRSSTTSTTSRRRSTTSSGSRRPRWSNGFAQDPIDGVSMAYTFADADGAGPQAHAVFREQRQPRHLPRRLDRLGVRPADALAAGRLRASPRGTPTPTLGALRPHQGLLAGRRSGRAGAGEAGRDEGAVPRARRGPTRCSRSAPGCGCASIPRTASRRPTRSWRFDATTTRMPEFTAPGLGRESNHVAIEAEFAQTPPACSTRWAARAAA